MNLAHTPPQPAGEPELPLAEALGRLVAAMPPAAEIERIALSEADAAVLAEALLAPADRPAIDTAAMDGFALPADARDTDGGWRVVGRALAGHPFTGTIAAGQAVRITTGAAMPAGCDAVLELEGARLDGVRLQPIDPVHPGRHVRRRGDEHRRGAVLLAPGQVLGPAQIALAAALGLTHVATRPRLRVGVLSSGDELGAGASPGSHDSNRPMLCALLRRLGYRPVDLGLVPDAPEAIAAAARAAPIDVLLTSGGVSAGEADHLCAALSRFGTVERWRLAVRPGRPFAHGALQLHGRPVHWFGLPGNPVAAWVAFDRLVVPALRARSGAQPRAEPPWSARLAVRVDKRAGRDEFLRARLTRAAHGAVEVQPLPHQGSARIASLSEAHCLLWLPATATRLEAGAAVACLPLPAV